MEKEKSHLVKGKMIQKVGYKKLKALLDEYGKNQIIEIINLGAVCELREQQVLDNGAQTITIKFYFLSQKA
jgi:hypothetical protein